ncbi:uncharacterized protein LOC132256045 [Phlebotomus argentipes]|uniref:uncharacterized protein LOC132256045 n=1 Tax=Phlebotomus argentipes TaxID=94469 RepID=UPI0028938031|nr:uncharacterized protein LOC132256045 [Phlebotomus argentipes]
MAKVHFLLMWMLAIVVSCVESHNSGSEQRGYNQGADIHALTSVSEEIEGISHRAHSSSKKGSDTKEDAEKSHAEESGKTKKDFDEDHESGHHSAAHEGHLGAHHHHKKAQRDGKSEKGFSQRFRKREYHKVNKFFGDEHKGGAYNKFGAGKSTKNSQTFAKDAAKHRQQVSEEGKSKKP